jgi:hypothetical protein
VWPQWTQVLTFVLVAISVRVPATTRNRCWFQIDGEFPRNPLQQRINYFLKLTHSVSNLDIAAARHEIDEQQVDSQEIGAS